MTLADLASHAFDLHRRGIITREALLTVLSSCIDGAALINGYAERNGLPSQQGRAVRLQRRT